MDLFTLQQKQYITLHGKYSNLEVNCPASVPAAITQFHVMWFLESTKDHTFTFHPIESCIRHSKFCLLVVSQKSKIKYTIFGQIKPLLYGRSTYEKENRFSWSIAHSLCRDLGAELPYFKNRDELDEFAALLRKSNMVPFVEAIFIGLKYNPLKVSENIEKYQAVKVSPGGSSRGKGG